MPPGRKRSSSGAGASLAHRASEDFLAADHQRNDISAASAVAIQSLMQALLKEHLHRTDRSVLHTATGITDAIRRQQSGDLGLAAALLELCAQADLACPAEKSVSCIRDLLLTPDRESRYTPLHWAIYQGNLPMLLLLLRAAVFAEQSADDVPYLSSLSSADSLVALKDLTRRPMELLQGDMSSLTGNAGGGSSKSGSSNQHYHHQATASPGNSSSSKRKVSRSNSASLDHHHHQQQLSLMHAMMRAVDSEGKTPVNLLADLQRSELLACRASLYRPRIVISGSRQQQRHARKSRGNSFDFTSVDDHEQNEFDLLSRSLQRAQRQEVYEKEQQQQQQGNSVADDCDDSRLSYASEVLTFGRAHHCALGVVASTAVDTTTSGTGSSSSTTTSSSAKFRPHRVQAFAQDTVGRQGRAVAVCGATHHTLVSNAQGHLFAFGLGKGGRLGTGNESPCSLPTRVRGALSSRHVVAVSAAENHSLCITKCGATFAWGSNRFGQLGTTSASGSHSGGGGDENSSRCCSPRRVEDLKSVFCVGIAAGEKHSVALSRLGEVFCWGDNSSGQLGTNRRSGANKVQRVEYLWNSSPPKACIALSASDQATMVLALPTGGGLPVNSVYTWGHGSLPSRVQFEPCPESRNRPINPVSIACARYHYVAATADGHVYTWGMHADALGTKKASKASCAASTPQLVTGLLPKNGGGLAVAVAASENHTAAVTDTGALYTWGCCHGKNVLGHEGVRFQPDPKRVPGVQRVVGVSLAKEHTVLLVGASFPRIPLSPGDDSLETLAARQVARHVDLFNVLPVAVMANRFENAMLKEYCGDFMRRNLDGVLNLCQKSVLNTYLTEQLLSSSVHLDRDRDGSYHPLLLQAVSPDSHGRDSLRLDSLSSSNEWLLACGRASGSNSALAMIREFEALDTKARAEPAQQTARRRSSSVFDEESASSRCLDLTTDMDLTTEDLALAKQARLTKEIRSIRKRLSQIAKLEEGAKGGSVLSHEEQEKVSRKSQLEADLKVFEPALRTVHMRFEELRNAESKGAAQLKAEPPRMEGKKKQPQSPGGDASIQCEVCRVSCTDQKNFELHVNGRKHKNKLLQLEKEEKKQAAQMMMAEQQRQQMEDNFRAQPLPPAKGRDPWNTKKSKAQPKFNLPPPPVPISDTVASPPASKRSAAPSLLDIMAEENSKVKISAARKPPPTTPTRTSLLDIMAEESKKSGVSSVKKKSTFPAMKSPPWASAPVVAAPIPAAQVTLSLGNFISTPSKTKQAPQLPGSWASPAAETPRSTLSAVNFADIQKEEQELKAKEDQGISMNGSWFLERRERAGSFREIEEQDAKEREHRLFVEEQLRIEKQIEEELRKSQAEKAAPKKGRNRNRKAKKDGASSEQQDRPSKKKGDAASTKTTTGESNSAKPRNRRGRTTQRKPTGAKKEAP